MTKAHWAILDRVTKDFAFRPCPDGANEDRHADREHVRAILGNAALDLVRIVPQSRELNHALNRLHEVVHWAHAAIDRHGVSSPEEGA